MSAATPASSIATGAPAAVTSTLSLASASASVTRCAPPAGPEAPSRNATRAVANPGLVMVASQAAGI